MGMRLGPSNIEDVVLGYLSSSYKHYYELPCSQLLALDFVLDKFKGAAIRYQGKNGNIPSVFIDGIDVLAKANPDVFLRLVTHAKILANEMIARVIFVSGEGSTMPLLRSTSAVNRSTELIEIGDIPDDQAIQFLMKKGIKSVFSAG